MTKVITITYDEQRDAFASGFLGDSMIGHHLREGEMAFSDNGRWVLKYKGEAAFAKPRMSFYLDALLGFMERTKDT